MRRLHPHEWEHLIQTKDDEIAARDQAIKDLGYQLGEAEQDLAKTRGENERLKHRCNALAYLHYGHYLVQRDRQSLQADIEACESALTALRAELTALPQSAPQNGK